MSRRPTPCRTAVPVPHRDAVSALLSATALTSILLSPVPQQAAAQEAAEPIEQITVTATRSERVTFETPTAIGVIDRRDISGLLPQRYADILLEIPGTSLVGGARRIAEEPTIRGFSDERVAIRVDGARQTYNQAHRGRFFTDPDLIRRIEVVRGGSSALYGSGALGGVLALETVSAQDLLRDGETIGAKLRAGWQQNGEEPLAAISAFGSIDGADLVASALYRSITADLEDGKGDAILDSQDAVSSLFGRIGIDLDTAGSLTLVGEWTQNEGENPTNANAESTPTTVVDRDTEVTSFRARYRLDSDANDWLDLTAVAYIQDADLTEDRFFDRRVDESAHQSTGVDVSNAARFAFGGTNLTLVTGIEAYRDEQSGTRDGTLRPQFPDADIEAIGVYAQTEIDFANGVSLIPGFRYDHFELGADGLPDRSENRVTPKLALGYSPSDNWYFWAAYSESFRVPSLTDLYADGVHFTVPLGPDPRSGVNQIVINEFVPNPTLSAEVSTGYEIGLRWRQRDLFSTGDRLQIEATAYRTDVEDYVEQRVIFISGPPRFTPPFGPLVFPGQTVFGSIDAETWGAEAAISYTSPLWRGSITGTWLDGENADTGLELADLSQNRITARLERLFPAIGFSLGSRVIYLASRDAPGVDGINVDASTRVDLFAGWSPREDSPLYGGTFRIAADNLFDTDYTIYPNGIPQPGRSIRVELSWQFGR